MWRRSIYDLWWQLPYQRVQEGIGVFSGISDANCDVVQSSVICIESVFDVFFQVLLIFIQVLLIFFLIKGFLVILVEGVVDILPQGLVIIIRVQRQVIIKQCIEIEQLVNIVSPVILLVQRIKRTYSSGG